MIAANNGQFGPWVYYNSIIYIRIDNAINAAGTPNANEKQLDSPKQWKSRSMGVPNVDIIEPELMAK